MTSPPAKNDPVPAKKPRQSILDLGPIGLLAATVAGSCGDWYWLLDLASHFRWYYFVIGLIWLVGTIRQKRPVSLWCLSLALAWNGIGLLPYYLPTSQPAMSADATEISLISLNVYTANKNKAAVVEYLRRRQPGLIVVMEIDVDWAYALNELKDIYPHKLTQPRADNFGIGVLSKFPLKEARLVELAGTELPNIVARIDRDGKEFQLIATHPLPPVGAERTRERNAQLREVAELARQSPIPCIVAGDFNATPWSSAFRDFSVRSGLRDSALGRGVQGSWNAKSWLIRIPIDHVFVSASAAVTRRTVGPHVGSDHFPVEATILLP